MWSYGYYPTGKRPVGSKGRTRLFGSWNFTRTGCNEDGNRFVLIYSYAEVIGFIDGNKYVTVKNQWSVTTGACNGLREVRH